MADADPVTLGRLNYWCREKHWRHVYNTAQDGLRKYGNDPLLKFFSAYSMIMEDRVQEGMRELEQLKDKRDVNICSIMALIFAHKKCKSLDREAVQDLDGRLKSERKQAGEKALYFAGLFLIHTGKYDKAREYIDRMLKANPQSKEGFSAKGWLELLCGEPNARKSVKYFDDALGQEGVKDIDALFGKAKYQELIKQSFSNAVEMINQVVVAFPSFLPAFIEKMKLQLCLMDWDQAIEVANRALTIDGSCLQALRYVILQMICREGNYAEAAQSIAELLETMDRVEPKNTYLYDNFAKVFARICGRNSLVLQQTYYMAERAVSLDNTNSDYVTELGYELLMLGKTRDSLKCYRNAMKLDETSVAALTGIIHCQLIEGDLDEASQQLDFLNEIQQSIGRTAELCYLTAVLAMKRLQAPEKVIALLNEAIEIHWGGLRHLPLGADYFLQLNPDFLLQLLNALLSYAPQQPLNKSQPADPVLKRSGQVLEALTKAVPGLLEALYLIGKVKFLSGDVESAQSTLQHCLDQDQTYTDAHILMAQIYLHQGNFKLANQSLEVGLSHNFEVREHPLYHLIKSRIFKKQGDTEEAAKTLQIAMNLPGVRTSGNAKAAKKGRVAQIGVNDRVSVFLELADALRTLDQPHEAAKVMQDALNDFAGTPEEIRINISNSDLALTRGDVEGALAMLRNITPEQPYFVQAREKMADIYLHHRKDKRLYASCYRELVDKQPSPHTCLLLGDAYMAIQEPEKAIEVYEAAMKKNPRDAALASKIGQALVKTHNYGKAINYYEAALKSGGPAFLRHDLAELLLKLRQYDKAEKILKQALDSEVAATDLDTLMMHTKYLVLLSKVHQRREELEDTLLALNKAKEAQNRVLKRAMVEQPDSVSAQKTLAARICCDMAEHAYQQREFDKSIKLYKEALAHTENDGKIMLKLCSLYLAVEDLDSCQHQCMTLLKGDKENDAATVMLADLMFRKNEYDQATFHFQQLLERAPDHYDAMARLVDLLRRAGHLEDVPRFLQLAESASSRATLDGGFNYCKGLYEWYAGDANNALKYFNKARKDSDWGSRATYSMIEICLNPDSVTVGGEVFEAVDPDIGEAAEKADSEKLAVRTAEKLIKELKSRPGEMRPRILENMVLVSRKHKVDVERALAAFMEICSNEREHVGALYGMAVAYMVLKQTPRARNQLKRIAKANWTMEDAEDLEKGWLLLSDIYIQAAKYDMALELLKRCLQYNKACCKAYEYMGYIMEKEQSYKDAAKNYELAWKYGNKSNPGIGFKLAFNYLKARRLVEAIDICHHVLKKHPEYPKIRKDILDKARSSIRV